mgnify:CR=1 FL=1
MKNFFNEQYFGEEGYMNLLNNILKYGIETQDRTGIGCKKLINQQLIFDFDDGFPSASVRPAPLRFAFEEFWMFLKGITDTKYLEEKNINIWKGNTSKEFLQKRGIGYEPEGSMGKAYGYQFRNFNGEKVDQLYDVVNNLRNDPFSRRHYVTFWNPAQSNEMALTPCFHSHQFIVLPSEDTYRPNLSLKVFSRSSDVLFGLPFNYQQYGLYLMAIANLCDMNPDMLMVDLTDSHIYNNQIEYVHEVLTREYYDGESEVGINKNLNSINNLLSLTWEDISDNRVVNKTPMNTSKPNMAI